MPDLSPDSMFWLAWQLLGVAIVLVPVWLVFLVVRHAIGNVVTWNLYRRGRAIDRAEDARLRRTPFPEDWGRGGR